MITTLYNGIFGEMDEATLEKRTGANETPDASVSWVEYWKDDQCVHRSVTAALKGHDMGAAQGSFG
jgi:hypothetical protein